MRPHGYLFSRRRHPNRRNYSGTMWPRRQNNEVRSQRDLYFRRFNQNGRVYKRSILQRYTSRQLLQRMRNSPNIFCNNCRKLTSSNKLHTIWNDLRKSGLFYDAIVVSNDKNFRVHRVILAGASDYFRAIFTNPLSSSNFYIRFDYPGEIVDKFLEFCYTGTCAITSSNVELLLPAADQFGIVGLVELSCSFLKQRLNPNNCWSIHQFCKTYFCDEVAAEARRFTLNHFLQFLHNKTELLSMSAEDLVTILSDDHLNVNKEEQVFMAIDYWIQHDLESRKVYATKLLKCIRFNLLNKSYFFETVLKAPYVEDAYKDRMQELAGAINPCKFTDYCIREYDYSNLALDCLPRIPYVTVFGIGGWCDGWSTNCMETYDIRANKWFMCEQVDSAARSYHALVSVNNLIYLIGGFDGRTHFNTVRCFDPLLGIWTEKACMHQARCYVSCVFLDGYIYAMGGYDGRLRLHSVEKYNIENNQWEQCTRMNRARSDAGAAVCNQKIYIVGGFNGLEVLDSAEMYDPISQVWTFIASMNTPRSGVCLVNYRGYIYAIGGCNGVRRLKSMERYHSYRSFGWDPYLPEMITQRSNFACTVVEDIILVVGGFSGDFTISLTEFFDGSTWNPLSSMEINRSGLAICTISGLPNAAIFSLTGKIKSKLNRRNKDTSGTTSICEEQDSIG